MTSTKRIFLVHWTRAPVGGGVESHLIDLANGLAARSHEVFLITGTRREAFEFDDSVQLVYSPELDLSQYEGHRSSCSISRYSTLDRLVSNLCPDVVHGHNLDHFSGRPLKTLLKERTRTPFVLVHTSHSALSDSSGEVLMPFVDVRLAVSHSLCGILRSATGCQFSCLYLPVDSVRFKASASPLEREEVNILLPARLVPEKGAIVALHALRAIRQIGIGASLVLASPPETVDGLRAGQGYEYAVKAAARRLSIDRHVFFEGVSLFEMPRVYAAADIVILPSLFAEPFGLAALEGMSCSRPVVMTARSGLAEVVRDQKTGILLKNAADGGLVTAVSVAVNARSSARRLGREARRFVQANFTVTAYLDALEEYYSGIGGLHVRRPRSPAGHHHRPPQRHLGGEKLPTGPTA
jgi:glycosyltransferase involved in cell wall biosynthesis